MTKCQPLYVLNKNSYYTFFGYIIDMIQNNCIMHYFYTIKILKKLLLKFILIIKSCII